MRLLLLTRVELDVTLSSKLQTAVREVVERHTRGKDPEGLDEAAEELREAEGDVDELLNELASDLESKADEMRTDDEDEEEGSYYESPDDDSDPLDVT